MHFSAIYWVLMTMFTLNNTFIHKLHSISTFKRFSRLRVIRGGSDSRTISDLSSDGKLTKLRSILENQGVDAFIIPTDDPHMSEYPPLYFNRREYISNFTGSAGTAIVMKNQALLFTDGRYHIQAESELDSRHWKLMKSGVEGVPTYTEFLTQALLPSSVVGIDPWVHSADSVHGLKKAFKSKDIKLKSFEVNPIDEIWINGRVDLPKSKIRNHDIKYAGIDVSKKLFNLRSVISNLDSQAIVISCLDEIAWLFNLRGCDVPCTPVFVAYAIVTLDDTVLFMNEEKISSDVKSKLDALNIIVQPYSSILSAVQKLNEKYSKIIVDPNTLNDALYSAINNSKLLSTESPIQLHKATKNSAELSGMIASHLRDGAAVVEFLAWLDANYNCDGNLIDEYDIDLKLTSFREKLSPPGMFIDRSFATIAGVDSNGAIVHYKANKDTAKLLKKDSMLLLDSGAQYIDGTTDVTRTIHMGEPTAFQMEIFTRVLKGHISIDTCVFPAGTSGCLLDSFARRHLWDVGRDFDHGVGHGVGAALSVHEGPQTISKKIKNQPLLPGMIVSNEPGYYFRGNDTERGFGVRIENLLMVEKSKTSGVENRNFLSFRRLTHIPYQKKLIAKYLLTNDEVSWINAYHADVREKILPLLESNIAKEWLVDATNPIS